MSDSDPTFASFELPEPLLTALDALGYESPSPIQAAAIPALLEGRDLIGQAQTGTGKTAAFALPLLARLDTAQVPPQVLVLTPTRELAIQVAEAFQSYARYLPGFHVLPIYGGQSMQPQLRGLRRQVHVIVGTPGRVADHLRRGSMVLSSLRALVLDEADEMLRMGFLEEVTFILEQTPESRQTALFSATLPEAIRDVARRYLREPAEIRIKARTSTVEAIRQRYWPVGGLHKLDALTRILELEDIDAVLVFVRTRTATMELAEKLSARGHAAAPLNGDLSQAQREKTIEQLRNGQIDVLVATDVAARGLDVPRISHVVNYDIPYDIEGYVHRIGRTGRAGRTGEAILFVAAREMRMLRAIERATRQPIEPMRAPSREAIAEKRIRQFKDGVFDTIADTDLDFFRALVGEMAEERGVEVAEIAAALASLAQRERPLRSDHQASERATQGGQEDAARSRRPDSGDGAGSAKPRGQFGAVRERPVSASAPEARRRRGAAEERLPGLGPAGRAEDPGPRSRSAREEPFAPAAGAGFAPLARRRHGPPEPPPGRGAEQDGPRVVYRLEVGSVHGATPKHIVGAIANEAGLDSRHIGRIDIHEEFSTVELPAGMPREVLQHLKKTRLGRHRFNLAPLSEPQSRGLETLSAESARHLRGSPKPRRKRP